MPQLFVSVYRMTTGTLLQQEWYQQEYYGLFQAKMVTGTVIIGSSMKAYQLLARLRLLTLLEKNSDGDLVWVGNSAATVDLPIEEEHILRMWELNKKTNE